MIRRAAPLILLALTGCALMVPQPQVAPPDPEAPATKLFAGAARIALTPVPHPVPLAGYGPNPRYAEKQWLDPWGEPAHLQVRAVSLRGERELAPGIDRVVLASLDSLIVSADLRREILARLVTDPGALVFSRTHFVLTATHTHAGIGGFWRGDLPEWASVGKWDGPMTARTAERTAAAIRSAVLAERPARIAHASTKAPELVRSRALETDEIDPDLLAIALDGVDGAPIAQLVAFAAHPTENYGLDRLSPLWPGLYAARLEHARPEAVAILLQGGLGNQAPLFPLSIFENDPVPAENGKLSRSKAYGATVARIASGALSRAPRSDRAVLEVSTARVSLPFPAIGAIPLPLLARIVAIPTVLRYWPDEVEVSALRLGDIALAFAPFELCAPTTLRTKEHARASGFTDAAVVSLANGWNGYAPDVVPWPWDTSGAASFGGIGMGRVVGERLERTLDRIAPRR